MSRAYLPRRAALVPRAILLALASAPFPYATAAEPPRVDPPDAAAPDITRFGMINIAPREVFDTSQPAEDTALFRLANRLHILTRPSTIQSQLLFESGQPYDPRLLEESERMLRTTRYLHDASIRPQAAHDGVVDVDVVTQDVWTLSPGISFGREGGKNTSSVQVEDLNLLGGGSQVGIKLTSGVDRDEKRLVYRDRQLGNSWWGLNTQLSSNSDGHLMDVGVERPFYALDTRSARAVLAHDESRIDSQYDRGEIVNRFRTQERHAEMSAGWSKGLVNGWARRWSTGLTLDERAFSSYDGGGDASRATRLLPQDRRLVYPWIGYEAIQDDYAHTRNRDQIGMTEDFSFGWHLHARMGFAAQALGSDRTASIFSSELSRGWRLSPRQTLFARTTAGGRLEADDGLRDGLVTGSLRYYFQPSTRALTMLSLSADAGSRLDLDHLLQLGGDNGVRGYPLRYQGGSGRWMFTAEERVFTDWHPFQLANVGGAVFFDMGRTWGRDPMASLASQDAARPLLKDVGFGLRLGNRRSAMGNVLHVDLAFPLGGNVPRSMQLSIQTRTSF